MRDIERADVQRHREQVGKYIEQIKSMPDRLQARELLARVAQTLPAGTGNGLARDARKLLLPGDLQLAVVEGKLVHAPASKESSDAAFERVLHDVAKILDAIDDFQCRVRENARLTRGESRDSALKCIAHVDAEVEGRAMWSSDVQQRAGLSSAQMNDALNFLRECGAIDAHERVDRTYGGDTARLFSLTPRGRDLADEGLGSLERSPAQPNINIGVYGNVGSLGNLQTGERSVSHVNQTLSGVDLHKILEALGVIRQHIGSVPAEQRGDATEHLNTIDDELATPAPRLSRLRAAFNALKPLVTEAAMRAALQSALDALSQHLH